MYVCRSGHGSWKNLCTSAEGLQLYMTNKQFIQRDSMFYTNPGRALTIVYCIFTNNFVMLCIFYVYCVFYKVANITTEQQQKSTQEQLQTNALVYSLLSLYTRIIQGVKSTSYKGAEYYSALLCYSNPDHCALIPDSMIHTIIKSLKMIVGIIQF